MATRVTSTLVDDLDASTDTVRTIAFAFDGTDYEIDLSADHAAQMRADLDRYLRAARRIRKTRTRRATAKPAATTNDTAAIRRWWYDYWLEQHLPEPHSHGIIPTVVRTAYHNRDANG